MSKTKLTPFEQALLDTCLEEFADIPAEEEIALEPSETFTKKSEALITQARKGRIQTLGKTVRRLLLIAAILAMLVTTALAVPAVREGIIRFFTKNAGTHYEFSFDPEQAATAPEYIEKVYKPTYIPEGFLEDLTFIDQGFVSYQWISDSGEYIFLDQFPIPNDSEGPAPDAEDVDVTILNLNGYEVFCVRSEIIMYHWTDNEYFYQLGIPASIPEHEQYQIFYSITLDPTAVIPN